MQESWVGRVMPVQRIPDSRRLGAVNASFYEMSKIFALDRKSVV